MKIVSYEIVARSYKHALLSHWNAVVREKERSDNASKGLHARRMEEDLGEAGS